ncbi:MAG TPA: patatin-like phospholipase family protein [Spirochaetota bacterium]|nr:patatin-like phospholipase family protein [Spirochaetota bacterium]
MNSIKSNKIGIALGSGGSRGISHISVLKEIYKLGISIDYVSGASMGAIIGTAYCAGKLEDFEKILLRYYKEDRIYPLAGFAASSSGIADIGKFMKIFRRIIFPYSRIEDLPIPLSIVCTEFQTGKPIAFTHGDIFTAIRASVSIPGALVPVKYAETYLIDGGVSNAVPVDVARKMGADKVIAVNINPLNKMKNRPEIIADYSTFLETSMNSLIDGLIPYDAVQTRKISLPAIKKNIPAIIQFVKKTLKMIKYAYVHIFKNESRDITKKEVFFPKKNKRLPNIVEILWQTIDIMQSVNTQAFFEKYKPDVIIEPDVIEIFPFDFTRIPQILAAGEKAVSEKETELKRLINENL